MPEPAKSTESQSPVIQAYRLPRPGERDPHFGLSRSWYYQAESDGVLKLIRLRKKGRKRGVTLVPYHRVREIVSQNYLGDSSNCGAAPGRPRPAVVSRGLSKIEEPLCAQSDGNLLGGDEKNEFLRLLVEAPDKASCNCGLHGCDPNRPTE